MSTSTSPLDLRTIAARGYLTETERYAVASSTPEQAFAVLGIVHPHHVETITAAHAALLPGTLVRRTGSPESLGTFFTGLRSGDLAVVTDNTRGHLTVSTVDGESARLSLAAGAATLAPASDLTPENVAHAARAAREAADGLLDEAYASANGLLGGAPGDEAALDALRHARTLRDYAFALGVLYG